MKRGIWPTLAAAAAAALTFSAGPLVLTTTAAAQGAAPNTVAISVSASANPVLVGKPVTFVARVAPALGAGAVLFLTNGTVISACRSVPLRDGEATCAITYSSAGTQWVKAEYLGSPAYAASTSAAYRELVSPPPPLPSTISVYASANPVLEDRPVTLVARVEPALSAGAVAFSTDGSTISNCRSVPLREGQAMCTLDYTSVGAQWVRAEYLGSPGYTVSTSAAYREEVAAPQTSTISVYASANPVLEDRAVTLVARVEPALSAGAVAFSTNGSAIGDCRYVPLRSGEAVCTLDYGSAGIQWVKAEYLGSLGYSASTSAAYREVIAAPSPRTAVVYLSVAANPVLVGRPVTLVARVAPALSAGAVIFTTNGSVISTCRYVPLHEGEATCAVTYGSAGAQLVRAEYLGSPGYAASTSAPYDETVTMPMPPPKTAAVYISAAANPALVGRPVRYVARIVPALSAGSVMFMSSGPSFGDCQAVPVQDGQAVCTVTYGSGGQYSVKAEYLGSLGYTLSVSAGYTEAVTASMATSMFSSSNPAPIGRPVTYIATVSPAPDLGTVRFTSDGTTVPGCGAVLVSSGRASCTTTYWTGGQRMLQAVFSGLAAVAPSSSALFSEAVSFPPSGYWLVSRSGGVYGAGGATARGGISTSASTGEVVGIAGTPSGKGYWVVTTHGTVAAFGDARSYGDLASLRVKTGDIVAIAPTQDGQGYWLIGRDGGMFTFGDAKFHGSVPSIGRHVSDIVGMVASAGGAGYLLVGSDGGVFTFGSAHYYGSLPGLGKHVHDIRAILPSSSGRGYVLVGGDGGAFVFGSGVKFMGSLPGEGVRVNDIVGIALTPDNGGYFMAARNGAVFGFGAAKSADAPSRASAASANFGLLNPPPGTPRHAS